jgi:hypothetical protein
VRGLGAPFPFRYAPMVALTALFLALHEIGHGEDYNDSYNR